VAALVAGLAGACNCGAQSGSRPPACGDGVAQPAELCDGNDLGFFDTCVSLGFASGALGCAPDCQYDTTACVPAPVCGNGVREAPSEECDGTDLGGTACDALGAGFTGGSLCCASDCAFDTAWCSRAAPVAPNDFNGDGDADFAVGWPDLDLVRIYFGGSVDALDLEPDGVLSGTPATGFGFIVLPGDLDGDGYDDLAVGAPAAGGYSGEVRVYAGGPDPTMDDTPDAVLTGSNAGDIAGRRLVAPGDVDGDAFADLLVNVGSSGNPPYDQQFLLFRGAAGMALDAAVDATYSGVPGSGFGFTAAAAGDVNGDTFADFAVASVDADPPYVSVFLGGDPPDTTPDAVLTAPAGFSLWGWGITAGDLDGDGFSDLLLYAGDGGSGAQVNALYWGGPGGIAAGAPDALLDPAGDVLAAGDYDADLFADVVTAHNVLVSGPDIPLWLYRGGPSAVWDTSADLTLTGGTILVPPVDVVVPGDLNGDGPSDVVLGLVGSVDVYLGGPIAASDGIPLGTISAGCNCVPSLGGGGAR
jgi:hypothetical protein